MKKIVVMACLAVFLAVPALADPYMSANFGLVTLRDADLSSGATGGELTFDNGYAFLGAIGGGFAGDTRGEIELGYRANDLDRLRVGTSPSTSQGGDIVAVSLMANLYKDFPLGMGFVPFVGGGIGIANVEADLNGFGINGKKDDTVFAYQLMAGGAVELNPQVKLDLQYRFFATEDPKFGHVEAEYMSHNFLIGLRFGF